MRFTWVMGLAAVGACSWGGPDLAMGHPPLAPSYLKDLPGEMRTTIQLKKVMTGTEVSIVQAGIPAVIPTEMCYLGWQESLQLLIQLVEPEIRP